MRLIEIYILPSQDYPPEKYQHYFTNISKTVQLSTGLVLKTSPRENELHIGVFDVDKLVAYVQLVKLQGYWQVIMQTTDRKHQNQGYIRRCIEYAVQQLSVIISDEGQTEEAKMVWTALVRRPNILNLYYLDLRTGNKQKISYNQKRNSVDPDPWVDEDPDIRIMASLKPISEETRSRMQQRLETRIRLGHSDPWIGQNFTEFNP